MSQGHSASPLYNGIRWGYLSQIGWHGVISLTLKVFVLYKDTRFILLLSITKDCKIPPRRYRPILCFSNKENEC